MIDTFLHRKELIPIVVALLAFGLGWLTTVIKDVRDRRRSANALIFVLLKMRFDVKRLDPELLIELSMRYLLTRFPSSNLNEVSKESLRAVIAPSIQAEANRRLDKLLEEYSAAVDAFAPYRPIVAYRLTGNDVASYQRIVSAYFETALAQPEVKADANAPAILAVIEKSSIELSRKQALMSLADDLRAVAKASSSWRRMEVWRAIRRQDQDTVDQLGDEFADQVEAPLADLMQKIAAFAGKQNVKPQ